MREVIIFGAGAYGKRVLEKLCSDHRGAHVAACLDNDMNKWGERMGDAVIMPPRELLFGLYYDEILICSSRYAQEIFMQLIGEFRISSNKIKIPYFSPQGEVLEETL